MSLRRRCRKSGSTTSSRCRRRCQWSWRWVECHACWTGMPCQKDGSCTSHRSVTPCSSPYTAHDAVLGKLPGYWSFSSVDVSAISKLYRAQHGYFSVAISYRNDQQNGTERQFHSHSLDYRYICAVAHQNFDNAWVYGLDSNADRTLMFTRRTDELMKQHVWSDLEDNTHIIATVNQQICHFLNNMTVLFVVIVRSMLTFVLYFLSSILIS